MTEGFEGVHIQHSVIEKQQEVLKRMRRKNRRVEQIKPEYPRHIDCWPGGFRPEEEMRSVYVVDLLEPCG